MADFLKPDHQESAPIHNWLMRGGKLVYSTCGGFAQDIGNRRKKKLAEYLRAGKAILIPCKQFVEHEQTFLANPNCKSDDPHVLALAKYTGTRILYTEDKKLMRDFKNKMLINNPRGKIYSGRRNKNLLINAICVNKNLTKVA